MDKAFAHWMDESFALALSARGTTLPNPAVGCVVLDRSGKAVARAATSPTGRPHAERQALEKAARAAQGGTLVVTLEPCVAFPGKKSPPCAAAVLLSGVETVLVGAQDPDPRVAGKGIHALRKAGMRVEMLDPDGRIADFYGGFGHFLAHNRPRVTLKVALSADGYLAAGRGVRTAITGPESRRFAHGLRAASDGILVGGSTAAVDDPELTVRDASGRSPRRFVLWPRSGLSPALKLWDGSVPTTAVGAGDRPRELPKAVSWRPAPANPDGIDLSAFLDSCGRDGLHDLLVEPGPRLLDAFLRHGLCDRLWLLRSPTALGSGLGIVDPSLLPQGPAERTVESGADKASLYLFGS